ncbi:type II methionyl aminopeptidase, partial [Candidatus Pacearchaeota archaeon CG10_big_fil_rev_8_21_14_0_10_35_13]
MVFDDVYVNDLVRAGEVHKKLKAHAKRIIKLGVPLIAIADEIDSMIEELGAKPAFPINLSINEVAAHYTPAYNDETLAHGLLKVDIGIQVDGAIADCAFSVDLDDNPVNKRLIEASRNALKAAIDTANFGVELRKVGKAINDEITKMGFTPITNLCGHQVDRFIVHAGQTVPNYDNHDTEKMLQSGYAIEPFATTGRGAVYEGGSSNIFRFLEKKPVRDSKAREVLDFIISEYSTLPFASRWLVKKFGTRALVA